VPIGEAGAEPCAHQLRALPTKQIFFNATFWSFTPFLISVNSCACIAARGWSQRLPHTYAMVAF